MADDHGAGDLLRSYLELTQGTRQSMDELLRSYEELSRQVRESLEDAFEAGGRGSGAPFAGPGERASAACGTRIAEAVRRKLLEFLPALAELGFQVELSEYFRTDEEPSVALRVWREPFEDPSAFPREGRLAFRCDEREVEAVIIIDGGSRATLIAREDAEATRRDPDFLDVVSVESTVRLFMSRLLAPPH